MTFYVADIFAIYSYVSAFIYTLMNQYTNSYASRTPADLYAISHMNTQFLIYELFQIHCLWTLTGYNFYIYMCVCVCVCECMCVCIHVCVCMCVWIKVILQIRIFLCNYLFFWLFSISFDFQSLLGVNFFWKKKFQESFKNCF